MALITRSTSELIVLFANRYKIPYKTLSEELEIDYTDFIRKLDYNDWSANEIKNINDLIEERTKHSLSE